ncbi:hypothetical protein WJ60_19995 [Burkholderia ubonensis]|nr:hypothetical protein WJ60_19995 [Burkholderia ubonensis]
MADIDRSFVPGRLPLLAAATGDRRKPFVRGACRAPPATRRAPLAARRWPCAAGRAPLAARR